MRDPIYRILKVPMIKKFAVIFFVLVAVGARAEEQVQAPVFKEGDFWKFKIVQKPVPGFSSTANEFPNGTFILRHDTNARMQLREIIGEKQIFPESPTYRDYILSILGLRQPRSSPTIFNKNLLPFPLYVGKQWQFSYRTKVTNVVNSEVLAEQTVTTRGGNFQALRIERNNQWAEANPVWGSRVHVTRGTYFYSPEAKIVVKYDSENDDGFELHIELLEFAPAQ